MYLFNIYTIKNQFMYRTEKHAMILAHLVKKGLYKGRNFDNCKWITMDNGLYEGAQVSTNIQDLIDLAKKSEINVNEIVIPDVVNNSYETFKLFKKNLNVMLANPQYTYMYVCQGENPREVANEIAMMTEIVQFLRQDNDIKITLAVSKLCDFNRDHPVLLEAYKSTFLHIHFLGLKTSFCELERVKNIIRSCDSCQLTHLMLNEKDAIKDGCDLYPLHRDFVEDKEVDLATDKVSYKKLIKGKEKLDEELKEHRF